jgi:hypothetical protein
MSSPLSHKAAPNYVYFLPRRPPWSDKEVLNERYDTERRVVCHLIDGEKNVNSR